MIKVKYRIQPNYCCVHLDFSKMLGKLVVKYVHTCILKVHLKRKKKTAKDLSNNAYAMFLYVFFLIVFVKAYVLGSYLNCIDLLMQFNSHLNCIDLSMQYK